MNEKSPIRGRNRFLKWCTELVGELFAVLLVTYLVLILLETIFPGSVSSHINLNHLLIIVIIAGVAAVLTVPGKVERAKGERLTSRTILMIICAGIGGAAIVCGTRPER